MPKSSERSRWLALAVICAAELMIVLDGTIVTVALPQIQDGLNFSSSALAWVVNAYLLTFGGLLLLSGRAADLFGRRRLFILGFTLFTAASLVCGLAPNAGTLIGARAAQGVGGAIITSVGLALLVTTFPEPGERAKAMGIWGFVASGGGSIGVTLGGVLTDALDWRWVFLVNVPVGVAAVALAGVSLPADGALAGLRGLDIAGALLATGASVILVDAFVGASGAGWVSVRTIGLIALAVLLAVAFFAVERGARTPLLPLHLLKSPSLVSGCLVSVLLVVALFAWFFFGTLYLQNVLGKGPLATGLAFLPSTLVMGAFSLGPSAAIARRIGPARSLALGLGLTAIGLALFARAPVDGGLLVDVLPPMLLVGLGLGIGFMPLFLLAMSDVSEEEAGISSGILTTSQQLGGALGLALLSALAASKTGGSTAPAALYDGYRIAFVIGAIVAAVAVPVTLARFRGVSSAIAGAGSGAHG